MRVLLAALALAALAATAHAAGMGGGHKGRGAASNSEHQKDDPQQKKAIDDAYKSAIGRIPDPPGKPDPWRNAR